MPIYCFTDSSGETHERIFRMGEAPAQIDLENDVATRDHAAEWAGGQQSGGKGEWPIVCYASGVNAAQAPELRKFFKDRKFDCEVTNDGDPVYRNPQHRTKALKLRGLHDESSFGTET